MYIPIFIHDLDNVFPIFIHDLDNVIPIFIHDYLYMTMIT